MVDVFLKDKSYNNLSLLQASMRGTEGSALGDLRFLLSGNDIHIEFGIMAVKMAKDFETQKFILDHLKPWKKITDKLLSNN